MSAHEVEGAAGGELVARTTHRRERSISKRIALSHQVDATVSIYSQSTDGNTWSGPLDWSGPFLSLPGYMTTIEDWPVIQMAVVECLIAWRRQFGGGEGATIVPAPSDEALMRENAARELLVNCDRLRRLACAEIGSDALATFVDAVAEFCTAILEPAP